MIRLTSLLIFVVIAASCHHQAKPFSFYYWKTIFAPDSLEKETLAYNKVQKLYLRYFDIDLAPADSLPAPVAPMVFKDSCPWQVIPVIFIRNRVFERQTADDSLAGKVFRLISDISQSHHLRTDQVQFDCDWTARTKDRYFQFLQQYQALSGQTVTCTIRLHQVKYPMRTGIPPLQRGVLMFYNMGNIDAGEGSSIYDPAIAERYLPSLASYPMDLDVALPIFSWGMQIRHGAVVRLLNKVNFHHFEHDVNFEPSDYNRYRAKVACFSGGYYFQQGDIVKIEQVPANDLERMIKNIEQHSNQRLHEVLFFDLDTTNLVLYDKDVFKKVLDHFHGGL